MALEVGELVAKMRVDRDGLKTGLAEGRWEIKAAADSISDDVESGLDDSGRRGGRSLVSAISGALPALGPAVVPLLATIGTAAGGVLGGAIAAAVILAVPVALAGGVLAAGIMAAAKDPAVGAAFAPLKAQATAALAKFAEPFKGPLIRAATTFGNALAQATPYLVQMGRAVAPIIDQLAPALAQMAVSALPGILRAVQAGVPLITAMIGVLPNLGAALSTVVGGIAAAVPWALRFLGAIGAVGAWIGSKLIPPLRDLAGTYLREARTQLGGVAAAFRSNEPQIRTFVHWIGQAVSWVAAHLVPVLKSQLVSNLKLAGGTIRVTIAAVSAFVTAIQKVVGAVRTTASAVKNGVNDIRSFFADLPGKIMSYLDSLPGKMRSAGARIIRALADGMASQARAAVDKVRNIVGDIAALIPGSPVKRGPLRSLNNGHAGKQIVRMLVAGIDSEGYNVPAALQRAIGGHVGGIGRPDLALGQHANLGSITRPLGAPLTVQLVGNGDPWMEALRKAIRVSQAGSAQAALGANSVSVAAMG